MRPAAARHRWGVLAVLLAISALGACSTSGAPVATQETVPPVVVTVTASPEQDVEKSSATPSGPTGAVPTPAVAQRASTDNALLSADDLAEARARWGDSVGIAVADLAGGPVVSIDGGRAPYAWSTTKVPIITQTLLDAGSLANVTPAQQTNIQSALADSNNDAALALNNDLKAVYGGMPGTTAQLTALVRQAGDQSTVFRLGEDEQSNYGHTEWSVAGQVEFLRSLALGCVLDAPSTAYLIESMGNVAGWQRWGLGTIGATAFKGGWGPYDDGGYLVRQYGLVPASNGNQYVVALTADAPEGTFEAGQALNTEVAQWVTAKIQQVPAAEPCTGAPAAGAPAG